MKESRTAPPYPIPFRLVSGGRFRVETSPTSGDAGLPQVDLWLPSRECKPRSPNGFGNPDGIARLAQILHDGYALH